jgi:hypothetical protein
MFFWCLTFYFSKELISQRLLLFSFFRDIVSLDVYEILCRYIHLQREPDCVTIVLHRFGSAELMEVVSILHPRKHNVLTAWQLSL